MFLLLFRSRLCVVLMQAARSVPVWLLSCPGPVWLALACAYCFYLFIYYFYLFYLLFIIYYIYILYYYYNYKIDFKGAAAGLLWRRLAAQKMTGRGRAGRCADLCGVSSDAGRADLRTFAAFRAAALSCADGLRLPSCFGLPSAAAAWCSRARVPGALPFGMIFIYIIYNI